MTASCAAGGAAGRILAVCGPRERDAEALRLAVELADHEGAETEALAVEPAPPHLARLARSLGLTEAQARRRLADEAARRAEEAVDAALPRVRLAVGARIGRPWEEIIRAARERGAELVVKAAEPFERASLFFSSVDQHLLRKCACPVWLRRPGRPGPGRPVVAAIDLDDDADVADPDRTALNLSILRSAARVAAFAQAPLHVLHVWEAPGEGLLRLWSTDAEAAAQDYARSIETQARDGLERLLERFASSAAAEAPRPTLRRSLVRGSARAVIPEEMRRLGADTLVLGTVGRAGAPGLIIGNTAEDVLNLVECSILAVKPPGYVSPVV